MQQLYLEPIGRAYTRLMQQLVYLNHPSKEVIAHRIRVMAFFDTYGAPATKEAFGVARSTLFLWKQTLARADGRLTALAPCSRAPHKRRQRQTDPRVIAFIKEYRTNHPGVGKETIKSPLDNYCAAQGIRSVSESTIGRAVGELKQQGKIPTTRKLSFYARSGTFRDIKPVPRYKKLRRNDYQPDLPGDLVQIDAITVFTNGVRRYLITAIDLPDRFGFGYAYKTLSSASAMDFLKKLQEVAPFQVTRIQTDNGSEFAKYFRAYVSEQGIVHYYNYPRSPKMNAYVERFNRTIQEQYVSWHLHELTDPATFNHGFVEYLLWYNTEKQHKGLGKLPPLRYYVDNFITNVNQSNMLWTLTRA